VETAENKENFRRIMSSLPESFKLQRALRISGVAYSIWTIYSHLAMQYSPALDLTFHALADGTRRSMIHVLAKGETRSASELGRQFRSAQPTISKHLKVLVEAGILERKVEGRVHRFRLRRKALEQAGRWIARHQAFWEGAVYQLDRLLAEGTSDDRG
jgi:DNA-binding transcriptional ArsR family regulator